jgi:hypothetical protein
MVRFVVAEVVDVGIVVGVKSPSCSGKLSMVFVT